LRIQQLEVPVETKTSDNVIVNVSIAVQYKVPPDNVEKAFYQLDNPEGQIESYVLASVRGEVPKMKLDDLDENKDQIAGASRTTSTPTSASARPRPRAAMRTR
jgi:regulator of protease activity HflC (stomatin/prohibitin superfamily)